MGYFKFEYNVEYKLKPPTHGCSGRLASQWDADPLWYGGPGGRAGDDCGGGDGEDPGGEEPEPPLQEWLTCQQKEAQHY